MPKTPGTHKDDDHSQQPRQKDTPAKPEQLESTREDHINERQKLTGKTKKR